MIEFVMSFLLALPVVGITVLCFVFGYDIIAKYVKDEPKPRKHKKHGVRCNMCEFCNGRKKKVENGYTYGRAYIQPFCY